MDVNQAKAFFAGYFFGDGHLRPRSNEQTSTTTSPALAIGLSMLHKKIHGRIVNIQKIKVPPTTVIEGRTVNQKDYYRLVFTKNNRVGFTRDDYSWGRCSSSESTNRNEWVYNIGVDEDESYIANNAIVHNCQSFSIAGKRGGFSDTRGTLFFDIARIARVRKPRFLVLENVKGLLSHDDSQTFATIIATLDEIGYDAEWEVLNSKYFGVPQNRERVFIVGHLRGCGGRKIFPLGGSSTEDSRVVGRDVSFALDANYSKGTNTLDKSRRSLVLAEAGGELAVVNDARQGYRVYSDEGLSPALCSQIGGLTAGSQIIQLNNPSFSQQRVYSIEGIAPTICAGNLGGGKSPSKIVLPADIMNNSDAGGVKTRDVSVAFEVASNLAKENNKPVQLDLMHLKYGEMRPLSTYIPQDLDTHRCLQAGVPKEFLVMPSTRIRRLTPTECERLQAFPDGWTKYGLFDGKVREISDNQRYKMMGNAVTTSVIAAIFEKLLSQEWEGDSL
jgi:DNA (cytosine-5)-methyltransferase 1